MGRQRNSRLPESIFGKAERMAQDRGHASVSDRVSELVEQDESGPFQHRKTEVETELIAGWDSGPATPLTHADWDEPKQRVREVHGKRPVA